MRRLARLVLGRRRRVIPATPPDTPARLLLFDFDGTIGDTFRQGLEILNTLAVKFKYRQLEEHEVEHARDMTTRQLMKFLGVSTRKLPSISREGVRLLRDRLATVKPLSGVPEALRTLYEGGTHLGIVTSNSEENVSIFLKNHELEFFRYVRSSSRLYGKAKEIRAIMKSGGYQPAEVVFVGDETRDIEAAHRARIRMAAVLWGYNSRKALEGLKPDYLLESPDDLLRAIPAVPGNF